jgi:hypothetical protein
VAWPGAARISTTPFKLCRRPSRTPRRSRRRSPPNTTRSLVGDLGDVFTALGNQSAALQGLVSNGLAAADAVGAQQQALSAGLKALPATLTTARDTAGRLAAVGQQARPVLTDLTTSLNELGPTVRELPAAGSATLAALHRLHRATPEVVRLLAALKAVAPALTQTVPGLDVLLRQARPAVAYLVPYSQDLASLFAGLAGEGSYHDASGEYSRVISVIAATQVATLPSQEQSLLYDLAKVGSVELLGNKGINSYPAPNTATDPQPLTSNYPHVQEDPAP